MFSECFKIYAENAHALGLSVGRGIIKSPGDKTRMEHAASVTSDSHLWVVRFFFVFPIKDMEMDVIKQKRFGILKCLLWNLLQALASNTNPKLLGHRQVPATTGKLINSTHLSLQ